MRENCTTVRKEGRPGNRFSLPLSGLVPAWAGHKGLGYRPSDLYRNETAGVL